jgi:hypothetical protein
MLLLQYLLLVLLRVMVDVDQGVGPLGVDVDQM